MKIIYILYNCGDGNSDSPGSGGPQLGAEATDSSEIDSNYDNQELMYNLYVPENYDSSKEYPMVVFMHDAGVVSNNPSIR